MDRNFVYRNSIKQAKSEENKWKEYTQPSALKDPTWMPSNKLNILEYVLRGGMFRAKKVIQM